MNKKQQVLLLLKPKVKAFGFSKKEIMSIAAKIADNLTSEEEASEEDVNAEINTAIDAVLPYLQISQSFANRVIEDNRKKNDDEEEIDDEEDDDPSAQRQSSSKKKNQKPSKDETPAWAKAMLQTIETLNGEITSIKAEKVTVSRKSKLETLLKDTGAFGSSTLKNFGKMKFENEEEFEDFYNEVSDDLKDLNQERANAGLANLGGSLASKKQEVEDDKPLSDAEIDEMVDLM